MSERRIRIIWPDCRYVPESTMRVWFLDAIDNGQVPADMKVSADSLETVCSELHHAGLVTLHARWRDEL